MPNRIVIFAALAELCEVLSCVDATPPEDELAAPEDR